MKKTNRKGNRRGKRKDVEERAQAAEDARKKKEGQAPLDAVPNDIEGARRRRLAGDSRGRRDSNTRPRGNPKYRDAGLHKKEQTGGGSQRAEKNLGGGKKKERNSRATLQWGWKKR